MQRASQAHGRKDASSLVDAHERNGALREFVFACNAVEAGVALCGNVGRIVVKRERGSAEACLRVARAEEKRGGERGSQAEAYRTAGHGEKLTTRAPPRNFAASG